jgi:hypothetical protein
MSKQNVYICDGENCNKQKGAINHWYLVRVEISILIVAWNEEQANELDFKHICGMDCLTKLISKEAPKLKL